MSYPNPKQVRKFYFLEYFYVLLKSAENSTIQGKIFTQFVNLKRKHRLGESRYRKRKDETEPTPTRMSRYQYTFNQVLAEAEDINLIRIEDEHIYVSRIGKEAIKKYESNIYTGPIEFNQFLLPIIEERYLAFRYILEKCYEQNPKRSGLLIFPIYSAYTLGLKRDSIRKASDLHRYIEKLMNRLVDDIKEYLHKDINLIQKKNELIQNLINAEVIPENPDKEFEPRKYNAIMKRVRDFWLKYFLQDLYGFNLSLNAFEIWAYRAKQIGILQITQFYPDPDFNGRIVFPFSVIMNDRVDKNFKEYFSYEDGKNLFMHLPEWTDLQIQEEFIETLYNAYFYTRQLAHSYFVNLMNVRERVCYSMRIPEYLFDRFLGYAYNERLRIRISLEVDKLPDETKVMYLHREPVMVDGKYRNIIAIDLH